MKCDAVSFSPDRRFRSEGRRGEFENEDYCLSLEGALTLHLKEDYLNRLLGATPLERRQIRKWHHYTAHLNCLYLLLDSLVLRDLKVGHFDLEEITIKRGGSGWLDSLFPFLSGAWRIADYAAVRRAVRFS